MLPEDIRKRPLDDLPAFVKELAGFTPGNWIFRGQSNFSWPLLPKAGREKYFRNIRKASLGFTGNPKFDDDLMFFEGWRQQAVAFCESLPSDDLECLAYAQHYGLATRLLDWTENPLVALFFAVESESEDEGVVYCYHPGTSKLESGYSLSEPVIGLRLYRPRPFDRRILAQQGVFTFHPKPGEEFPVSEPWEKLEIPDFIAQPTPETEVIRDLHAFPISSNSKRKLMQQLMHFGITRKTLFPDLEGLSSYINWCANGFVLDLEDLRKMMKKRLPPGASAS